MKREFTLIFVLLISFFSVAAEQSNNRQDSPEEVGRKYVNLNTDDPQADSLVQSIMSNSGSVVSMACCYESVDQNGRAVTLSGKIYFPKTELSKRIVVQTHYTITSNQECPSECDMPDAVLRDKGYALVLPDYLGYGITRTCNHPYLDYELTAQNTVDMYLAAKQFLERLDLEPESDSIVIVGFSQGGQTAIGTLRLLEMKYPEVAVKQCFAGSGPYDVARTYDVAMAKNKTSYPFTIPMLVMGTSWSYNLDLDVEQLLQKRAVERAEKYLFTKEHTATEVVLLHRMGLSTKVSRYMTKQGMDKAQPETQRLYSGLVRSSIVHVSETDTILGDWTPRAPIFLMHSMQDNCVPFENAESLKLMFEKRGVTNVEYDFGNYGDHLSSFVRFIDIVQKRM